MARLGAPEIGLIILAILLLFGYKKLPDASRSLGRSLRIFKGEMKGMKDDDVRAQGRRHRRPRSAARSSHARHQLRQSGDLTAQLQEEARIAEARAAELRARAEQARAADGTR